MGLRDTLTAFQWSSNKINELPFSGRAPGRRETWSGSWNFFALMVLYQVGFGWKRCVRWVCEFIFTTRIHLQFSPQTLQAVKVPWNETKDKALDLVWAHLEALFENANRCHGAEHMTPHLYYTITQEGVNRCHGAEHVTPRLPLHHHTRGVQWRRS